MKRKELNSFQAERIELLKKRAQLNADVEAINRRLNELWDLEHGGE